MNVAIVGSEGYIATFLKERLQRGNMAEKIIRIDKVQDPDILYLDLVQPDKFPYGIFDNVDIVIFTAAVSGPDLCAEKKEWCWAVNVAGTEYVIIQALKRKARVLFFSSDAVYGNDCVEVKDEHSEKKPCTPYGEMKNHVEETFQGERLFKAIRLSYVVSARDKFVSYCLQCMGNGQEAEIFHPFYRNCITITDVLDAVCWMIQNWDIYLPGVYNVAGCELISRIRIADEMNRIYNNRLRYCIVIPEKRFFQNRPAITQMCSCYNKEYQIIEEKSFTEKLKRVLGGDKE